MKAVCVDGAPRNGSIYSVLPVAGTIYTVEKVAWWGRWTSKRSGCGLWLVGLDRAAGPGNEVHPFAADRFRPAVTRKTDISIFKAMLNHSPSRETV